MTAGSVFHDGELAVQQRAQTAESAQRKSAHLTDRIPVGAVPFIAQQTLVIVGSVDSAGAVWASVLCGMPGFLQASDQRTLQLDTTLMVRVAEDPMWENTRTNSQVGLLFIELHTRRRLRVNGRLRRIDATRCEINVNMAYANCPKYIQPRLWPEVAEAALIPAARTHRQGSRLQPAHLSWIEATDTFFVASAHPEQGADASHRGGSAGFVRVLNGDTLVIPDYTGNNLFNTLGNFVSYPQAGLLFIEFATGRLLQINGQPEIVWDAVDHQGDTGGTNRYWRLHVHAWRETAMPALGAS